jgi:hypothetical protein
MRRTALAALCLTTVAAAGLTGCLPGEDKAAGKPKGPFAGLTGGEIADRSLTATTAASSLRLRGDIPDDESGGTIVIDMALNKKGECVSSRGTSPARSSGCPRSGVPASSRWRGPSPSPPSPPR